MANQNIPPYFIRLNDALKSSTGENRKAERKIIKDGKKFLKHLLTNMIERKISNSDTAKASDDVSKLEDFLRSQLRRLETTTDLDSFQNSLEKRRFAQALLNEDLLPEHGVLGVIRDIAKLNNFEGVEELNALIALLEKRERQLSNSSSKIEAELAKNLTEANSTSIHTIAGRIAERNKAQYSFNPSVESVSQPHNPPAALPVPVIEPSDIARNGKTDKIEHLPRKNRKKIDIELTDYPEIDSPQKFIGKMQYYFDLQHERTNFVNFKDKNLPLFTKKDMWHAIIHKLSEQVADPDLRKEFQAAVVQFCRLKKISKHENNFHRNYAEKLCLEKCLERLNANKTTLRVVKQAMGEYLNISISQLGGTELMGTQFLEDEQHFLKSAIPMHFADFCERMFPFKTNETDELRELKLRTRKVLEHKLSAVYQELNTAKHQPRTKSNQQSNQR